MDGRGVRGNDTLLLVLPRDNPRLYKFSGVVHKAFNFLGANFRSGVRGLRWEQEQLQHLIQFFFPLTHRHNLLECGGVEQCQKPGSHLDDMKMLQAAYRQYTAFPCRHENKLTFDVKRGQITLLAIDVEGGKHRGK